MLEASTSRPTSRSKPPRAAYDPFRGTAYRAIARLAGGGTSEVFLVEHTTIGEVFAAKLLHANLATDPRLLERMRIEAEALAGLKHANIVAAFDFQRTVDRRPFVVMEYLKGRTLDNDISIRGPMPPEEALGFTSQLLSALQAAHELGIIHRDIKPSNLFLCDAMDGPRVLKVLDFGVARVLPGASPFTPDPSAIPTATGILVGTPHYLSPEGAVGKKVDVRADLYAASLMLYITLTGHGPFDDLGQDTSVLSAHAFMEARPPSKLALQPILPELDAIVLKGLTKNPDLRYQTAAEFKQVVDEYLDRLRSPSRQSLPAPTDEAVSERAGDSAPEPVLSLTPKPRRSLLAPMLLLVLAVVVTLFVWMPLGR